MAYAGAAAVRRDDRRRRKAVNRDRFYRRRQASDGLWVGVGGTVVMPRCRYRGKVAVAIAIS